MLFGNVGRGFSCVALGGLDCFAGLNLDSVLFIGRYHIQRQKVPQCINCQMDLITFSLFSAVVAGPASAIFMDRSVRLSKIVAVSTFCRLFAIRRTVRRSWASDSTTLALSQHCPCW